MTPNTDILAGLIDRSPYPIYLVLGDELIVAVANSATLKAWGKDKSVIGKPFSKALPELKGQPFEQLLRTVISTAKPYRALNDPAEFIVDGQKKVSYFTFSYEPLINEHNEVIGVVCYATDVTELVESTEQIKHLGKQALEANTQLASTNKKLEDFNEILAATNKELTESYRLLELSEKRFRHMIQQAPFAICVIQVIGLTVTDVNDLFLELIGKQREQVEGLNIWEGVPEAADQYAPIMQRVIALKSSYAAKEAKVNLIRSGTSQQLYIDFIYEPVINHAAEVTSIMVVGIDVSEKVNIRKAIQESEERNRLAVEAADIGTYEYRFATDDFVTSERFNKIIGVQNGVSRKELVSHYHPEDSKLSELALQEAKKTGKVLYETRIFEKGQPTKWVRFQAKVYYDLNGQPEKTLGTAIDITQYKAIQHQKDDFISIASHELKTPITSLKASLQVLDKMRERPHPTRFPMLLDQALRSMNNISELVEDLLNVSKMNHGQIELKKSWFNVADMLNRSCQYVHEFSRYSLVLDGNLTLKIFADENRIEQVIINFVSNIIKYAPNSHIVYMNIERIENMVQVSVRDTGPGILPEKVPQLFERYYRADPTSKHISGLGLGLYISAEIIRRHGGDIGVKSKLGHGSTFWFTLPVDNTL